jgi:hypothetical protein
VVTADGTETFWFDFADHSNTSDFRNVDVSHAGNLLIETSLKVAIGASATSSDLTLAQGNGPAPALPTAVCTLSGFGDGDSRPRWSPDGTQFSFTKPDGVHVASAPTVGPGDTCVIANDHLVIPGGRDADWSPYTLPAAPAGATTPPGGGGSNPQPVTGSTTTASVAAPLSLTGAATVTYSQPVSGAVVASATVGVAPSGAAIATTALCKNGATAVTCSTGPVTTLSLSPVRAWLPGQSYRLRLSAATGVAGVDSTFRAPTLVPAAGPGVSYQWATLAQKSSYGGTLAVAGSRGATASLTFAGPTMTWFSTNGPTRGLADVYVDGKKKATVNEYATTAANRVPHALTKLGRGNHVLTIKVRGSKGSRHGKGTSITVDAVKVGTGKVTATPATTASWSSGARPHADTPGEAATVAFAGTGISWTASISPASTTVTVYLDGKKVKAPQHTLTGLNPGVHKLRLVLVKGSLTLTSLQIA